MLLGIIFCEFDNLLGPVIVSAHPENVLPQDVFEPISDYIIARPEVCGKFTTVILRDMQVLGYPLCIANDKYHRNALLFNVCFLLSPDTDLRPYQPVLRKLANLLRTMEIECEFLYNKATKERLGDVLRNVYDQIAHMSCVALRVTEDHAVCVSLRDAPVTLQEVHDWDVPVRVRDLDALVAADWELSVQQILPHLDGLNHVHRIALNAQMPTSTVRACIAHLLRAQCVQLLDIFQYSNVYTTAEGLSRLATELALQRECVCVRALCAQIQSDGLHVVERRFITFGLLHGLIRRVHAYPVQAEQPAALHQESSETCSQRPVLDGSRHLDALCCEQMKSLAEVREIIAGDTSCVVLMRG